ncbi:MAG TPA: tetratricopeptide repeat protein [Longimicrobiales bacterium]
MGIFKKIFGDENDVPDYYREGLELLKVGKYHEALTSLRLALRSTPGDMAVMQQIAITYTRIGMTEEAAKTYRQVLAADPNASGAHYGLAFLLLRDGQNAEAEQHLRQFLQGAPSGPEAAKHVAHARETLAELKRSAAGTGEVVENG